MNFHGRGNEIKLLQKTIEKPALVTCMIYGRRRIGKSELIKHVIRNTEIKSLYYECKETTEQNNTESLSYLLSDLFGFPKPVFSSLEELLSFLFRKAEENPLILVLDEYPYLRNTVKGLDSILQSMIDNYRGKSQLKLIICGSYIEVMLSLLRTKNPLFGRLDRVIKLTAMDYKESSLFYPDFSDEDKVRLYCTFGGIPYYNRLIDSKLSVRENIIELIASPDARLSSEVPMYLKSELSRITNANEVIEALSKGYSRYSDILSQSHVSSSPTLSDVLDKLVNMEIVSKSSPINDENNKRKTGYYISDQLTMFYYRYCFRYSSQLSLMDSDLFYDRFIEKDFEASFVPRGFEAICKEFLIRQNREGKSEDIFEKIGKYWYDNPEEKTNGEFDIVTESEKGYAFYEAKSRKEPISQEMIDKEIEQVHKTGLNCYRYGFFSRSGFKDITGKNLFLIELKDLYR